MEIMGVDWIMTVERPDRHDKRGYIHLGKKSEMGNELWKIWSILKDAQPNDVIRLIPDWDERYSNIVENKDEWKDLKDELEQMDFMTSFYEAEELSCGLHLAMYKTLMIPEIERIKKQQEIMKKKEKKKGK